jgi:hypothetical protein
MEKGTNELAVEGAAASERSNVSPVKDPVEKRFAFSCLMFRFPSSY